MAINLSEPCNSASSGGALMTLEFRVHAPEVASAMTISSRNRTGNGTEYWSAFLPMRVVQSKSAPTCGTVSGTLDVSTHGAHLDIKLVDFVQQQVTNGNQPDQRPALAYGKVSNAMLFEQHHAFVD